MALNDGLNLSSQLWGKQQLSGHPSSHSPRSSSAWSTQDGFAMGVDPERDLSLEVGPWRSQEPDSEARCADAPRCLLHTRQEALCPPLWLIILMI
jgi:hypothetical protein